MGMRFRWLSFFSLALRRFDPSFLVLRVLAYHLLPFAPCSKVRPPKERISVNRHGKEGTSRQLSRNEKAGKTEQIQSSQTVLYLFLDSERPGKVVYRTTQNIIVFNFFFSSEMLWSGCRVICKTSWQRIWAKDNLGLLPQKYWNQIDRDIKMLCMQVEN